MLDACAQLLGKGVWFTSHINENLAEIATVAGLFPGARHYLDTYCRHGLVTSAQRVRAQRPPRRRRARPAGRARRFGRALPDQQQRPGQRPVPAAPARAARDRCRARLRRGRGHRAFLPKEALQAYFVQQLLGPAGLRLTPVAPAVPGDPGRRPGARPGRPGRRPRGRQGLRRGLAAPGRREHAGGQPASRPRHLRRAGQDVRPGHPGGRGRGVDTRRARRRRSRALGHISLPARLRTPRPGGPGSTHDSRARPPRPPGLTTAMSHGCGSCGVSVRRPVRGCPGSGLGGCAGVLAGCASPSRRRCRRWRRWRGARAWPGRLPVPSGRR